MTIELAPLKQNYYEDVNVGDELPGFSYKLGWTEMVQQVSGSQDFYAVHHDKEFAQSGGHRDIFYNTGWTRANLFRLLSDFAGTDGWVRKFEFAMRKMNHPDDTVTIRGTVVSKEETPDGNAVHIELGIDNDREGGTATPAKGMVYLPKRG